MPQPLSRTAFLPPSLGDLIRTTGNAITPGRPAAAPVATAAVPRESLLVQARERILTNLATVSLVLRAIEEGSLDRGFWSSPDGTPVEAGTPDAVWIDHPLEMQNEWLDQVVRYSRSLRRVREQLRSDFERLVQYAEFEQQAMVMGAGRVEAPAEEEQPEPPRMHG